MTQPDPSNSDLSCIAEGTQGDLMTCVLEDLGAAAGGFLVVGLLVGGTTLLSLYLAGDGEPAAPTVVTILLGSALVPILPAQYVTIAWSIVVLGIAFGAFAALNRWVLRQGV
jgi:hypothetical protein